MNPLRLPRHILAVLLCPSGLLAAESAQGGIDPALVGQWILDQEATQHANEAHQDDGALGRSRAERVIKAGFRCTLSADGSFEQEYGAEKTEAGKVAPPFKTVTPFKLLKDSEGRQYLLWGTPGVDPKIFQIGLGNDTLRLTPIVPTTSGWRNKAPILVLQRAPKK